jgi:hypothetical protein
MLLLNFSTFFLQLFLVAISFGMFAGTKLLASLDVAIFKLLPYFGAGLLILAVATTAFQFVLAVTRFFGTYIKITEDGIEYQDFPYYGIYCQWHEIVRLEKITKLGITVDALIPSTFQHKGKGTFFGIKLREKLGIKEDTFITLSGFSGWSNGKLAKDIRKYAGHIFTDK